MKPVQTFSVFIVATITLAFFPFSESFAQRSKTPSVRTPSKKPATVSPSPEKNSQASVPKATDRVLENTIVIPVIVSDPNGEPISDLKESEFLVSEDGVTQRLEYFVPNNAPLQMVLLLDTSGLAAEKLEQLQRDAMTFIEKLSPQDRVCLVSFDSEIRNLSDFTSDRGTLRQALAQIKSGAGSRVFDAAQRALKQLKQTPGRKAIVLFSDGVDWHSQEASADVSINEIEAAGATVYLIRYGTRDESERTIRKQLRSGKFVDYETIFGNPAAVPATPVSPATAATDSSAGTRPKGSGDSAKLPNPPVVTGRPDDNGVPPLRRPRYPDDPRRVPGGRVPDSRNPGPGNRPASDSSSQPAEDRFPDKAPSPASAISPGVFLDDLYMQADAWMDEVAEKSGGKVYRADTMFSLPVAFEKVAADLRTQYAVGYSPANNSHDGKYRKVEVKVNRKNAIVRVKPGYRAGKR